MTIGRRSQWAITIVAVLAVMFAIALMSTSGPEAQAAPVQQGKVCTWQNIGANKSNLFHMASGYDTDKNAMYLYGGVNEKLEPQNRLERVMIADPANLKATTSIWPAPGAKKLVGTAGAYRAKGDTDDSAVYWIGGTADPMKGQGSIFVQRLLTKSDAWGQVSPTNPTEFKSRFFASAAYDPVHDVVWVVGGTNNCKLGDVLEGKSCNASPMATQYLKFDDPNPGDVTWYTLAGATQAIYGATLVYDSANKQMLLYGGTKNVQQGQSTVTALDLADADVTKASWKPVSTSGTAPKIFFHSAAYAPGDSWMIVYGGVNQNFMQDNESTNSKTYALDLSAWPTATWVNLTPAGNPGGRVASGYGWSPLHSAMIVSIGRDQFEAGDPVDEPPDQKIQKNTYALTCAVAPTDVPPPTKVPTNTPGGPTPVVTDVPPTPTIAPGACDIANAKVPAQVINDALANPGNYYGYDLLCNPNLPPSNWNQPRRQLSLTQPNKPFHPLYNSVEWKCGCP